MAILSFEDRIIDLAGSLGTADDNAIQQWLIDGCYDVMDKALKIGVDKNEFAVQSDAYTGSMTVALDDVRQLVNVQRDGYSCRRVSHEKRNFVDPNHTIGANSVHRATSFDPVFYIFDNELIVKPNPTASEQGYYSYVPEYSISSWGSSSAYIDKFPKQYYEYVILYAAIATLDRQLLDLLSNTNIDTAITAVKTQLTDATTKFNSFVSRTTGILSSNEVASVADALSNAELLFDGALTTNNIKAWLDDEDSEMSSAVLSSASGELKRAQSELGQWSSIGDAGAREVSTDLSLAQALISDVKSRMERDKQQYEWQQERRNFLKQEYISKFPGAPGDKGGRE